MHTFNAHHDKTRFHYNSDMSGEVWIEIPSFGPLGEDAGRLKVSGRDLLEFLAERVRDMRQSQLEEMPISHLLGLFDKRHAGLPDTD